MTLRPVVLLGAERLSQPVEAAHPAGYLCLVEVVALAQAFPEGIEPRHLTAARDLLVGGRQTPQRPVERDIGRQTPVQAEFPGDARERAALLSQRQHLAVELDVVHDCALALFG